METKARLAGKIVLMALLMVTAAGMVQAQEWPLSGKPYFCRWGAAGKSLVTLTFNESDFYVTRTGTNLNVYPAGNTLSRSFTMSWDWGSGSYNLFDYYQADTNTRCRVTTHNYGNEVIFDPCTKNGQPSLSQYCTQ